MNDGLPNANVQAITSHDLILSVAICNIVFQMVMSEMFLFRLLLLRFNENLP